MTRLLIGAYGADMEGAASGIGLGDAIARAARQVAAGVLGEAPVAIDVVCVDRSGTIVGCSR